MSKFGRNPDETGFDDRLRGLAACLLDQHAPEIADRVVREDDLFRAMQTFATIRELTGTADDLARCEVMGLMKVRLLTEPAEVF